MATIKVPIALSSGSLMGGSSDAQWVVRNGTNFPRDGWLFSGGSTDNNVYFKFPILNYGSGNITLEIHWQSTGTNTSGNVVFGAQISAITPNTDTQDAETDGLATAQTVQDAHLGTTAKRVHECSIAISNLDSVAAGDEVTLFFYRDASDTANDTYADDVLVTALYLTYSDT
jgi:hypothetical protein